MVLLYAERRAAAFAIRIIKTLLEQVCKSSFVRLIFSAYGFG